MAGEVEPTDITDMKKKYRERSEGDFPEVFNITLKKAFEGDKKYGENPNQQCATYVIETINERFVGRIAQLINLRPVVEGKGGLSLTNEMDIARAMDTLKFFRDRVVRDGLALVIMKHNIVSAFAGKTIPGQTQAELFRIGRDVDRRSNMGGTVASTQYLDMETARAMFELKGKSAYFPDVVAFMGYDEGVVGYLQKARKELRIAEFSSLDALPRFQGDDPQGLISIKEMPGGRIGIQDIYLPSIKEAGDFALRPKWVGKDGAEYVVNRVPTEDEQRDLLTAWYLNVAGARSNGLVAVKDCVSVAMGSGQVERIGAIEQMIVKGMQKAMDREGVEYDPLMGIQGWENLEVNPFEGAAVSSDAFTPFRDSYDTLARVRVSAVAQPFGSKRDGETIEAANEHNMATVATLERCFGHW